MIAAQGKKPRSVNSTRDTSRKETQSPPEPVRAANPVWHRLATGTAKADARTGGPAQIPLSSNEGITASRRGGQALPESERGFFESRFGRGFGGVRIHSGHAAAQLAESVGARAFTVGGDIFFGAGEYRPGTTNGRQLIAHELTHVVQQGRSEEDIHETRDAGPERMWLQPAQPPNPRWGPFRIRGDTDYVRTVRSHLNQLNATANGRGLIRSLVNVLSGTVYRPITIEQSSGNLCGYDARRSGPTEAGAIRYDPSGCVRSNACPNRGDPNWPSVSTLVYLHHEITHAYIDQVRNQAFHDDRECMATGLGQYFRELPYNENRLRCERGLPVRPCYGAECVDHAMPECSSLPSPTELGPEEYGRRYRSRQPPGAQRPAIVEHIRQLHRGEILQRLPIRESLGTSLGSLRFQSPGLPEVEGEVRLVAEAAPRQDGGFEGFESRLSALAQTLRLGTIAAVGEDRGGRFHALDTGWPLPTIGTRVSVVPRENPTFSRLWWVMPMRESGDAERSYADSVRRAQRLWREWRAHRLPEGFGMLEELGAHLEREFAMLLVESLGVGPDFIHIVRSAGDLDPQAINLDIDMIEAEGRGGISRLPTRADEPTERPSIRIGPAAFEPESRLHVLSTVMHEAAHLSHASRSLDLWERWQRGGGRGTFRAWLDRQLARRRASAVERDVAAELAGGPGWAATETLARLDAFSAVYHRLPVTATITRFAQIDLMANYWASAPPTIREASMDRLAEYIRTLDGGHRNDFESYARDRRDSVRGARRQAFWSAVVDRTLATSEAPEAPRHR